MKVYIKVGDKYFKDFESETKGYTGHTALGCRAEIKKVKLTGEKQEISTLSAKNIVGEIIDLMRFDDIKKENILIEVEE